MPVKNNQITVAMITRNEEKAVAKVIEDIRSAVPGAEILIVDSSDDQTAEIAKNLGAHVIRQFPPKGYGPAMDRALREGKGDVTITMDCDDTYPVEFILPIAAMVLEDGYHVVDASRLAYKPSSMAWVNYLGNYLFALLASLVFWRRLTDLHSGMRAYKKGMVETFGHNPQGAALPVALLLRPIAMGLKVASVFIPYRDRVGDSVMDPWESSLWTVRRIFSSRFML